MAAWLALLLLHTLYTHGIKINIAMEECFTENIIEAGTTMAGSFVAIPPQGILASQRLYDLSVTDPDGGKVYEVLDKTEEQFTLTAQKAGMYKFCLVVSDARNGQRRWHSYRQVHWELSIGHTVHHDKGSNAEVEALWVIVEKLDRSLQEVIASQDYFKNREARHRITVESTSWRVQTYAILRAVLLVVVCITQLVVIRRMFDGPLSGAKGGLPQYIF